MIQIEPGFNELVNTWPTNWGRWSVRGRGGGEGKHFYPKLVFFGKQKGESMFLESNSLQNYFVVSFIGPITFMKINYDRREPTCMDYCVLTT